MSIIFFRVFQDLKFRAILRSLFCLDLGGFQQRLRRVTAASEGDCPIEARILSLDFQSQDKKVSISLTKEMRRPQFCNKKMYFYNFVISVNPIIGLSDPRQFVAIVLGTFNLFYDRGEFFMGYDAGF